MDSHPPLRVLFIGFGNVGQRLAAILGPWRDRFPALQRLNLRTVGIVTRSRGAWIHPRGIDLSAALERIRRNGGFEPQAGEFAGIDAARAVSRLDYDVLVELSALDIERRGDPALSYVRTALERGRHVVTANKGPAAFAASELRSAAQRRKRLFLHESAVMDGAPVFSMAREGLRGARILRFSGILNSTTNFVLSRIEQGGTFQEAVRDAQGGGFAEADPSHDLQGWDAAAKIAVLANGLMEASITPFEIERQELTPSCRSRVDAALGKGRRLKVICRAWREESGVRGKVALEEVEAGSSFYDIEGAGNALRLEVDLLGPTLIVQQAPDLTDTAYGVLNDLLTVQAFTAACGGA